MHCVQSVQSAECRCGVVNDESCHLDPTMRRGTEREREAQRERDRERCVSSPVSARLSGVVKCKWVRGARYKI